MNSALFLSQFLCSNCGPNLHINGIQLLILGSIKVATKSKERLVGRVDWETNRPKLSTSQTFLLTIPTTYLKKNVFTDISNPEVYTYTSEVLYIQAMQG